MNNMTTVEKLNNVLGWLTAMNFDKPELTNDLEEPLNVLSEAISEVENFNIGNVIKSVCYASACANNKSDNCNHGNYHCSARITDL